MDNILITGADGQLGSELRSLLDGNKDYQCFYTDVPQLDITDQDAVDRFITENSITRIINCAAYNNVDGAETDAGSAIRINVTGPMCLAAAAARHGIYLIHISTDFVFDGKKRTPYHESDRPSPLSEYGRTKLAGELAVKRSGCLSIIIRTAWLYSPYGKKNFVRTMIEKGLDEYELNVVFDQVGTPTYARDLAEAILHILPQLDTVPRYGEVFHYSDEGSCSRAEFADKIMKLKSNLNTTAYDTETVHTQRHPRFLSGRDGRQKLHLRHHKGHIQEIRILAHRDPGDGEPLHTAGQIR